MKFLKNKQGQGMNYTAITIFLFVFGLLSIIMYVIYNEFITQLTTTGLYTGQAQVVGNQFLAAFLIADWLIVLLLVGLIIALGITSFRLATAPVFFVVTIIMGIFWGFISYIFSFTFNKFIEEPTIHAASLLFPRTILVCTNLHWVGLVAIVIGSITLYAKKSKGQGLI